jgi:hypothetical protein
MAKTRNTGNLSDVLTAGATYAAGTTPPVGDNSTNLATTGYVFNNTGHGQCRFVFTNTTTATLVPYAGNKLMINGQSYAIPSAGITVSTSGLAASTLYYVYAFMNAGVMTLEAVTTTHTTNAATGVEVKSGDATRTLVGMMYVTTGSVTADSGIARYVASYFNRRNRTVAFAVQSSTSSTTTVDLAPSNHVFWLDWGDDEIFASSLGTTTMSLSGASTTIDVSIDGSFSSSYASTGQAYAASVNVPSVSSFSGILSEGLHFMSIAGVVSSGSATYNIGYRALIRQ